MAQWQSCCRNCKATGCWFIHRAHLQLLLHCPHFGSCECIQCFILQINIAWLVTISKNIARNQNHISVHMSKEFQVFSSGNSVARCWFYTKVIRSRNPFYFNFDHVLPNVVALLRWRRVSKRTQMHADTHGDRKKTCSPFSSNLIVIDLEWTESIPKGQWRDLFYSKTNERRERNKCDLMKKNWAEKTTFSSIIGSNYSHLQSNWHHLQRMSGPPHH